MYGITWVSEKGVGHPYCRIAHGALLESSTVSIIITSYSFRPLATSLPTASAAGGHFVTLS